MKQKRTLRILIPLLTAALFCSGFRAPYQEVPEPETPQTTQKVMAIRLSDAEDYMVDQVQADFIIASLEAVEARGFERVILLIDTYGGAMFSARDINECLLRLKIPTTAYVETKAVSAGAFIAYACDEIVMEANTTIGDAQVITQNAEGGIDIPPEKIQTVYRSDWRKACAAKGHSYAIARAYFDVDAEVLEVASPDEQPRFLTRINWQEMDPTQRPEILRTVSRKGELLTLTAEEAAALGIGSVVENFDDYLQSLGYQDADVHYVDMDLNDEVMRYLGSNSWIFFLLTLIGLNGLYMEIKTPGFGIGGLTALLCFILIFGSRYMLGTASPVEIAMFVLGVALCLAEIFVIPGFGVAGITGLGLLLGSLLLASMPSFDMIPTSELRFDWLQHLALLTLSSFGLSLLTAMVTLPLVMKIPYMKRQMVPNNMTAGQGFVMDTVSQYEHLLGTRGLAEGVLRPSGKMRTTDGKFVDVVSDGPYLDSGTPVEVVQLDGNRIVVRACQG